MRSFCEQYGVAPLRSSDNPKDKKDVSKGRKKIRYHKKQIYNGI